ncbi:MAG TPA: hypothetical protein VM261_12250 [Kofleriaceae bacterium]|nr:hypothetical protein [Kofleriaceae bacterium]
MTTPTTTAPSCPFCDQNTLRADDERAVQACHECATKVGLVPMPPSRRPPAPCTRCNHMVFLRVIPREHSYAEGSSYHAQVSAPMYVTHRPTSNKGFFATTIEPIGIARTGVGLLETYICRKCGFVEWYCVDVETIPAHPHLMSEEIDYADRGDGPYR